MLFKRLVVYLCPALIFLCFWLFLSAKELSWIIFLFVAATFILFFTLKYLIKEKFFSSSFYNLAILPWLLLTLTAFFLLILGADTIRLGVTISCVVILLIYLESLFLFYYQPAKYYPNAIENLSSFLTLLIFFLLAINLNALSIFLNLPLWSLSLLLIFFLSLLLLQNLWANKVASNLAYVYIFIANILITEIYWSLSFLPANFFVNGVLLSIFFYLIWGVLKAKINDKLDSKLIRRYLVISVLLLILIVLSNSWT